MQSYLERERESHLQSLNINLQTIEVQLKEKLIESAKSQKEWQYKCGKVFTELTLMTNTKGSTGERERGLRERK